MPKSHRTAGHRREEGGAKPTDLWLSGDSQETARGLSDQVAELSALMGISSLLSSDQPFQESLRSVCALAAQICSAQLAFVHLMDSDGELVSVACHTPDSAPRDSWERMSRVYGRRSLQKGDAISSPSLLLGPGKRRGARAGMGGICSFPLVGKARGVGSLSIGFLAPHRFTAQETDMLNAISSQLSTAVERNWLRGQLRQQLERANNLRESANQMGSSLEPRRVMDLVIDQACTLLAADSALLFLSSDDGETEGMEFQGGTPWRRQGESGVDQGPLGIAVGEAARSGRPTVAHNPFRAEANHQAEGREPLEYAVGLAIPLIRQEETLGVLVVCYEEKRRFEDSELSLAEEFAAQAAGALGNALAFEEMAGRDSSLASALDQVNNHGIALLDDRLTLSYANPAVFWLLGMEPREVPLSEGEWITLLRKCLAAGPAVDRAVRRALSHPEETTVATLKLHGAADSCKPLRITTRPLRRPDGTVRGRVALLEKVD